MEEPKRKTVNLCQCVYVSAATHLLSTAELREIVTVSRRNNLEKDITGMLLYVDGSFMQALEGDKIVVAQLLGKIEQDARHTGVIRLTCSAIDERSFTGWSMGFAKSSREEFAGTPGFEKLFAQGGSLQDVRPGQARTLMNSFKPTWRPQTNLAA